MSNIKSVRQVVKETVADIDYYAKLTPKEREWLDTFIMATAGNDMDAQDRLADTPAKFSRLYKSSYEAAHARERDIMTVFTRVPNEIEPDDDALNEVAKIRSNVLEHYKCSRCLSKPDECECPTRQRNQPYGREDYVPVEENEDHLLAVIDVKRRIAAYDLLPYGNNPTDLRPGHTVQICLPLHLFKDAWGLVRAYRKDDDKYLIEVKSKRGLRDRDGTVPKEICVWVSPKGLRRYPPMLVSNG